MKKIIMGLKTTTTNENNQAVQDLGAIWEKFFGEKYNEILAKYSQTNKVYAVYTNYENDFQTGNYDFYLGVETTEKQDAFENIEIPETQFKTFTFAYKKPEDTFEAWKTIWANTKLNRSYTFDIEEYDYEKENLKIYISVK